MKRLQAGFLAAVCFCASAGVVTAQGRNPVDQADDGADVVVYAPELPADGGGADAVVGATLSIDVKAEGWLVELDRLDRDAVAFLFLGLPNPTAAPFRMDFGHFGHVDLAIAYPSAPILLGLPDLAGHAELMFARPTPLPPEIVGYTLAVQGVEAFFVHFVGDAMGHLWTVASYRPTATATIVLI